jgi:hypothetical protein
MRRWIVAMRSARYASRSGTGTLRLVAFTDEISASSVWRSPRPRRSRWYARTYSLPEGFPSYPNTSRISCFHVGSPATNVGEDDRHITSIDEDGVALAAIKALHAETTAYGTIT